jgi:hypothetical protein
MASLSGVRYVVSGRGGRDGTDYGRVHVVYGRDNVATAS